MARRLAATVALLLVAAACGGAEDDNDLETGTSSTLSTGVAPTTTAAEGAEPSPGVTTPGATAQTPRTTARPGAPGSQPTSSTKASIDEAADTPVGGFARTLLAPGPATSLVLDVRVGDGATPNPEVLDVVAGILRSQSGKPVSIGGPTPLRGVGAGRHTSREIRSLASEQGTPNRDGVAVVHVLYLAGSFETDDVLGVAVRGDTVALFTDAIDASTSPFVGRTRLERAVLTHELGHLLGLVDLVVDRNRDDPEHQGHSRNRSSVMFWAVETSFVGQVLGGPPPVDFDAEDLADLRRIRTGS